MRIDVCHRRGRSLVGASPALAQDATQPTRAASRYTFNRVNDGFLRLDQQTGRSRFAAADSVGWACQAVPEDRAALEKEIARLQEDSRRLKKEVAGLARTAAARGSPADPEPPGRTVTPKYCARIIESRRAPRSKMPGGGWST